MPSGSVSSDGAPLPHRPCYTNRSFHDRRRGPLVSLSLTEPIRPSQPPYQPSIALSSRSQASSLASNRSTAPSRRKSWRLEPTMPERSVPRTVLRHGVPSPALIRQLPTLLVRRDPNPRGHPVPIGLPDLFSGVRPPLRAQRVRAEEETSLFVPDSPAQIPEHSADCPSLRPVCRAAPRFVRHDLSTPDRSGSQYLPIRFPTKRPRTSSVPICAGSTGSPAKVYSPST